MLDYYFSLAYIKRLETFKKEIEASEEFNVNGVKILTPITFKQLLLEYVHKELEEVLNREMR